MPWLAVIGFTLDLIGKLLIAYTAIRVHYRFWQEHRIDEAVFAAMRREQKIGLVGVVFMIAGYLLQLPAKLW